MITKDQALFQVKNGKESACLDKRDYSRLVNFFDEEYFELFGFTKNEEVKEKFIPEEYCEKNILQHLEKDLTFAIEKAENQRGISAYFMFEVIKMWLWLLEDSLSETKDYHDYGLPFFKTVAKKYSLEEKE